MDVWHASQRTRVLLTLGQNVRLFVPAKGRKENKYHQNVEPLQCWSDSADLILAARRKVYKISFDENQGCEIEPGPPQTVPIPFPFARPQLSLKQLPRERFQGTLIFDMILFWADQEDKPTIVNLPRRLGEARDESGDSAHLMLWGYHGLQTGKWYFFRRLELSYQSEDRGVIKEVPRSLNSRWSGSVMPL